MKKRLLPLIVMLVFAMTFFVGCSAKTVDEVTAKADLTSAISNVQTAYAEGASAELSAEIKAPTTETTSTSINMTAKVQFKMDVTTPLEPKITMGVTTKITMDKEVFAEVGFIYDGTTAFRYFDSAALSAVLAMQGITIAKAVKTDLTTTEFMTNMMAIMQLISSMGGDKSPATDVPETFAALGFATEPSITIPDIFEAFKFVSATSKNGNTTVVLAPLTAEGAPEVDVQLKITFNKDKVVKKVQITGKVATTAGAAETEMDVTVKLSGAPKSIDTSFNKDKTYEVGNVFDFLPTAPVI